MENIQSLSICCPSKTGKCINHCKTCTARQHTNPYENKYDGNHVACIEYWKDVIKRMEYAQSKGCTTVMLTGSNEPQQNRRWLEGLYLAMQTLRQPFVNIEIQTTGTLIDDDYLKFLKEFGVTTIALSTFNIFNDATNRNIIETCDKTLNVEKLCKKITNLGMNLRLCINITDFAISEIHKPNRFTTNQKGLVKMTTEDAEAEVQTILNRCHDLGANQVTFRKMWSAPNTPEHEWIKKNTKYSDMLLNAVKETVKNNGTLLNILPYGAARYDYLGFSIVIDTDSMAKDENNTAIKYYIIRENGKMYSSWDSPASIVF